MKRKSWMKDQRADSSLPLFALIGLIVCVIGAIIFIGISSNWSSSGSGNFDQNLNTTASVTFANVATPGSVDGVDISALLLKTTKTSDLGNLWDKSTKIAYGDTSFADQNLLQASSPKFVAVTSSLAGGLEVAPYGILFTNEQISFGNGASAYENALIYRSAASEVSIRADSGFKIRTGTGGAVYTTVDTSGNIATPGTVDGVDISALLLKTSKVTDLATIWDKTTKIAYGDTDFADQSLKTSNNVVFADVKATGFIRHDSTYAGALSFLNSSGYAINILTHGLLVSTSYTDPIPPTDGIQFGADVNLYRSASNVLKTDDTFQAAGYKSSDGSTGASGDLTIDGGWWGGSHKAWVLSFKNGILTAVT